MKSIDILIMPDGQSRVETRGFSGPSCREASQFLEQALGRQSDEQLTAEFHQTEQTRQQQSLGS